MKIKKYNTNRPKGVCCDCGLPYKDFSDLIIDDTTWELINPTYIKDAGLLCPNCICKRLKLLGLHDIKAVIK